MSLSPCFEVIATGNELLDSSIVDRHTQRIAEALRVHGFRLSRAQILPDDFSLLCSAFVEASLRSQVVFVTGGLGPTDDDLSLEAAAKAFGREMRFHPLAEKNVLQRMKQLQRKKLNEGHVKQMLVPEAGTVLKNREGTAPGVELSVGDSIFFFMPGVPKEFESVFSDFVLPRIVARYEMKLVATENLIFKVFGMPESELNRLVRSLRFPPEVEFGFRTHFPENHIKFRFPKKMPTKERKQFGSALKNFKAEVAPKLFSEDLKESFEESVFKKLSQQKVKVSLAESCTGGLASSMLTRVPGSSGVMDRSFVTYSNESKIQMLQVSEKTLARYGAVSIQTVKEMAEGCLKASFADRALSISGIAGPGGGSLKKPVGSVCFGLAQRGKPTKTHSILIPGFSRQEIQLYSAYTALSWLAAPGSY